MDSTTSEWQPEGFISNPIRVKTPNPDEINEITDKRASYAQALNGSYSPAMNVYSGEASRSESTPHVSRQNSIHDIYASSIVGAYALTDSIVPIPQCQPTSVVPPQTVLQQPIVQQEQYNYAQQLRSGQSYLNEKAYANGLYQEPVSLISTGSTLLPTHSANHLTQSTISSGADGLIPNDLFERIKTFAQRLFDATKSFTDWVYCEEEVNGASIPADDT